MRSLSLVVSRIIQCINPFTRKEDGNDSGYREHPLAECEDDLVIIDHDIKQTPIYAVGAVPKVCPYYGKGIGGGEKLLVRQPVLDQLYEMNEVLHPLDRQVLVLDAYRSPDVQAALFRDLYARAAVTLGLDVKSDSPVDIVRMGLMADDIASFASLDMTSDVLSEVEKAKQGDVGAALAKFATDEGKDLNEVAELFVTFLANTARLALPFSITKPTAHGNGGALDFILADLKGNPTIQGVPFDFAGPSAKIDYFESMANMDDYTDAVRKDPMLQQYLRENEVNPDLITEDSMEGTSALTEYWKMVREERRIWWSLVKSFGWTIYWLEPWHANARRGFGDLPMSGNTCQAILSGAPSACWTNEFAIREAPKTLKLDTVLVEALEDHNMKKFATTHI